MALELRTPLADSDLSHWTVALNTGFLRPPEAPKEEVELRREQIDLSRTQGVFDGDRCVATFRSFAQRLTAVGGADVPADAISNVAVSPTHRRRGLLSRMMEHDLRAAKERGEAVATLIAAEYPIYGRYGFGPATWITEWEVDVPRAGLDPRHSAPVDGGRVDFADADEVRKLGPALHERLRARQHGAIDRPDHWWRINTGQRRLPNRPWTEPFYVLYRSPDGSVDGLLAYTADDHWEGNKRPHNTATVLALTTVTPAAERALWHFLLSVDWVTRVHTGRRAPDDLLPLLLGDPRAAQITTYADWLWLRPLDVPQLLETRTYPAEGSLVLELRDAAGLAGGRYFLEAGPDGAACATTGRPADLTMDIGELSTLWLGDESAVRLASLGRIAEERPGAAALADRLLRTPRRPWCPDGF
ncbi:MULTISPECIES: GNAT family N-acetyltransferase [unclassified Streptomyces]|uniref:GNAT family N-acetyltransferase n=1 Tax=unclassified Streptomyces TaxID=2593676 RepID=UPI00168BC0E1|nr:MULTISPECIES: GNAT family N-acetyltransferase [unclassified Streptomyces]MBD3008865.1 GNAT family N-acetyltransferase [Streptomyces sp. 5-10]